MGTVGTSGNGEDEELWTTGQAAAFLRDLGITRRQVVRLISEGVIPAFQVGTGKWRRVRAADVRAFRREMLRQLETQQRTEGA